MAGKIQLKNTTEKKKKWYKMQHIFCELLYFKKIETFQLLYFIKIRNFVLAFFQVKWIPHDEQKLRNLTCLRFNIYGLFCHKNFKKKTTFMHFSIKTVYPHANIHSNAYNKRMCSLKLKIVYCVDKNSTEWSHRIVEMIRDH